MILSARLGTLIGFSTISTFLFFNATNKEDDEQIIERQRFSRQGFEYKRKNRVDIKLHRKFRFEFFFSNFLSN